MSKLDRKIAPQFNDIEKIDYIKADYQVLKNGIPVYLINAGFQDICKIDFIFNAGIWHQTSPLVASSTNEMLAEGSKSRTSKEISETIDFYGAILNHFTDKDFAGLSLVTLNKHLDKTLDVLYDIIKNPVFPESELITHLQNRKQQFIIDSAKTKTLAHRKFWNVLFGKNHPYGNNLELNDFDNLDKKQLFDFHKRHYTADNCKIIISGKIKSSVLKTVEKYFGDSNWQRKSKITEIIPAISANSEKLHFIDKHDAVQSAIRIGKITINKYHEDFIGLQILNTVFGGYFGSRLMSNIREDKGFTYGIGSAIGSMLHSGFFVIVTEVGADVTKATIKEIYKEMKILREELIGEEELKSVKSYIMGELLKIFDGPFALSDSFRSIIDFGLDYSYFDKYIETVKNINSGTLNVLANKYLNDENLYEIIAGKYD
ncbi:MAG: pitrilysin family protein [Bacteroidota bacterium]